MGIFDFFKKSTNTRTQRPPLESPIPDEDKKYYQPDSYYTDVAFEGTPFEKKVITFEDRKKTAIPSRTGLYPAEILLLEYCSYGTYPHPKNGYSGFWWFEYGIRDVGSALKSLENRGYITFSTAKSSLDSLTISQLKDILLSKGLPVAGKKADLVMRVSDATSEEEILDAGIEKKYELTALGKQELSENEYVPYMHKAHNKTTEDESFGMTFNVWSINKLLGTGDKSNWKAVVSAQENKRNQQIADQKSSTMRTLEKIDPELFRTLRSQDQQLGVIQEARRKYDNDKNLDYYIAFWEMLWKDGGLLFDGSKWHFELPNLYIESKRYDDALIFLKKLKKEKKEYADKADSYINKVEGLKSKQSKGR